MSTWCFRKPGTSAPTIAPALPAHADDPEQPLALVLVNTSAANDQKFEITSTLNTPTHR